MPDQGKKKKGSKLPGFLLWLVFFVILLGAVLAFIISQTRIKQVVVSGSEHYTNDEITAAVGISGETTILDALMGRIEMDGSLPYIKEVVIDYLSFNSIHIMVTEKEVISYIPYQGQYLALDKDGYIVGYENEKLIDRPSVNGLYFNSATLGQKLDVSDEVLKVMLEIHHLSAKYTVPLDEVNFVYGDGEMIEGVSGMVTIVFGENLDLDRKMKDAAEVLRKLDVTIAGTLDLQVDSEHYIFKESIGARYYLTYGERYLAIGADGTIRKISVHRMKHQPLVTGLTATAPEVDTVVTLTSGALECIDLILTTAEASAIQVTEINFTDDRLDGIDVWIDNIRLEIGDSSDLERKMNSGAEVILTLPETSAGYIDLRSEKASYEFIEEETETE